MRQSGLQSNHGRDLGTPCHADKGGTACVNDNDFIESDDGSCWWLDNEWAESCGDSDSTSEDGASDDVMPS
eukprot:11397321-Karenia_brevis.AAC.1